MVDAANATVSITLTSGDIKLCAADCGILGVICNGILSLLPGTSAGRSRAQIATEIKSELERSSAPRPTPRSAPRARPARTPTAATRDSRPYLTPAS